MDYQKLKFRSWIYRVKEKYWFWISKKVPHKLVYFVLIRAWAYATCGKYGAENATTVTMDEVIRRWELKNDRRKS